MNRPEKLSYEFGRFLLDPTERLLLRDGRPVQITPKCFDILVALVQNGGRLMGKDVLLREVWPNQFVEEGNLSFNISTLRKVLGEGAPEHHYIETVPKRGYRFIADLRVVGAQDRRDLSGVAAKEAGEFGLAGAAPDLKAQQDKGATGNSERAKKKLFVTGPFSRHKVGTVSALTALVIAVGGYFAFFAPRASAPINSVVVLPFVNVGNDPHTEYLSDGLSESLINNLSQLPQLKVIGRSSAFKYKGEEVDPEEVARVLGVQATVTGRVTRRGDELHISAEMVNALDKTQVWGGQYTIKASDIQEVREEMARAISEKLRLRLTGAEEQRLTKRVTQNPEAYQLYLNGMFYRRKAGVENVGKSLDYFNQAVTLDPNFALAWAEVANANRYLAANGLLDPKEASPKAKGAAQKALELDEGLAEAHVALGIIKNDEWDWAGAEREYKRAIELNPNLAEAHLRYRVYLSHTGRHAEALAAIKRAQELDPLRIGLRSQEGAALYCARRYDEAIQQLQNVIKMEPDYSFAHATLGYTYAAKGMYGEAIAAYQKAISIEGERPPLLCHLGYALAQSGKRSEAQAVLDKLKRTKEYVSPVGLATLYVGLGDKDGALASLERAYAARDLHLQGLKVTPSYDSLRTEPRFQNLMRVVGLPP